MELQALHGVNEGRFQFSTFLSESPDTVSMYCSWIMKAARLAVYEAKKMTAKKAQTRTMILLVVPLGFSTGTELLKTMPHSSHTDFPMVNLGPPGAEEVRGQTGLEPAWENLQNVFNIQFGFHGRT